MIWWSDILRACMGLPDRRREIDAYWAAVERAREEAIRRQRERQAKGEDIKITITEVNKPTRDDRAAFINELAGKKVVE